MPGTTLAPFVIPALALGTSALVAARLALKQLGARDSRQQSRLDEIEGELHGREVTPDVPSSVRDSHTRGPKGY